MSCTCLACLQGVRIRLGRGEYENDEVEAVALDLADRIRERADMLAERFSTENEIRLRMPAGWEPRDGWFELRDVKRSNG